MNPRYSTRTRCLSFFLVLTAGISLTACSSSISDSTVERTSINDVSQRLRKSQDGVLIVDTRSAADYANGHLPGARRLELPQIDTEDVDPSLKGHRMIIVYGQNPGSGAAMAISKRLLAAEVGDVRLMEDGFASWEGAGKPVESSK